MQPLTFVHVDPGAPCGWRVGDPESVPQRIVMCITLTPNRRDVFAMVSMSVVFLIVEVVSIAARVLAEIADRRRSIMVVNDPFRFAAEPPTAL